MSRWLSRDERLAFTNSSPGTLQSCRDPSKQLLGKSGVFPSRPLNGCAIHWANVCGEVCAYAVVYALPPPVLTVYRPSAASRLSSGPRASLLCLARRMSIGFAEVSWLADGSPLADGTSISGAVAQQPDKTFQISSYLSRQACDLGADRNYTCQVTVGSSTFRKTISTSECTAE
ncbi:hypothetical protein CRUP_022923 [Coryphaenoides rupestris]|nr:hypothetical protein CRUP_022923 [Coryphaenoides rupestris]